jgi:hypothetical protein
MPSNVQVKVNSVGDVERGNFTMVEIKGYDHTNNKNISKSFFKTKKDGGMTKNAEKAGNLSPGDWIEMILDDSSYKNMQSFKPISAPAGGDAGASSAPSSGGGGGGGGNNDKMSKEEWALKDAKKELSMARHKAIEASAIMNSGKGITKAVVESMEKLAARLTAYILTGDFDGEVVEPTLETIPAGKEPGDEQGVDTGDAGATQTPGEDDDIPF